MLFRSLGALLALPLTLMVKSLLLDNDPRARWVGVLISSSPDSVDTSDCEESVAYGDPEKTDDSGETDDRDDSGVGVATE